LIGFTRVVRGEWEADAARCGDDGRPPLRCCWRCGAESLPQRFSVLKSGLNFLLGTP